MQWIAIITMLIDHVGMVWFPDHPVWRIIGRTAMPIYTYYVAFGMIRTSSRSGYVGRLALLAALSQIPFSLLFNTWNVNMIGTFLVCVLAVYAMDFGKNSPLRFLWLAAAAIVLELTPFDYGAYALLLLLVYRNTSGHAMWLAHLGLNVLYWIAYGTPMQMYSLLPTLVFALMSQYSSGHVRHTAPRWIWRAFYPAHLLALFLIASLFGWR